MRRRPLRTARGQGMVGALAAMLVVLSGAPAAADLVAPPAPVLDGPPPAAWPASPDVSAPVHLLVDVATGQVLAGRGGDELRPVASTVKILTALTVVDRLELDGEVVVGDEVVGLEGASVELTPGEEWTVRELLEATLLRSGNDAAAALAVATAGDEAAFVEMMRASAQQVGIDVGASGAVLTSSTGLDDQQLLTAGHLATLGRVLLDDPGLRSIVGQEEVTLPDRSTEENRNLFVDRYPDATGIKTGFTAAAGNGVVASAQRGDRELIAVVLGAGPDPERFDAAVALLDHGFDAFGPVEVAARRTLLVGGGTRTIEVEAVELVAPVAAAVVVEPPLPARLPDGPTLAVPIVVDGDAVGSVDALVEAMSPTRVDGGAALGVAAADGVHAALRAARADPVPAAATGPG